MSIYTKDFWRDLGERSVSTFGQVAATFLAAAIADALAGGNILEYDWTLAVFVIAGSTLLAVLKGLGAAKANPETGASLGTAIPKGHVAAVERVDVEGAYEAEEAAPYEEGTPVDVVPDFDSDANGHVPDYPAEIDAGLDGDEQFEEKK